MLLVVIAMSSSYLDVRQAIDSDDRLVTKQDNFNLPIVNFSFICIVRLTSINLQKKILKNPVFKSTFFHPRCLLIYDIYELWQLIRKSLVHYLKGYPLGLYVNYIFWSVKINMKWVQILYEPNHQSKIIDVLWMYMSLYHVT